MSDLEFATNEHLYAGISDDDLADIFAPRYSQRRYDWEDWSRKELMTLYANHLNR